METAKFTPNVESLPEAQYRIYKFLLRFFGKHERFPNYREIMKEFNYASPSAVQCAIEGLEHRGLLSRVPRRPGTIRLTGYRVVLQKVEEE